MNKGRSAKSVEKKVWQWENGAWPKLRQALQADLSLCSLHSVPTLAILSGYVTALINATIYSFYMQFLSVI